MANQTRGYVEERYGEQLKYYWKKARYNRYFYQWTRYLTIIFGSLVTLFATLSQKTFTGHTAGTLVAIITPTLAALLTMLGGLTQSFQWGAAWRDMVLAAEALERELDRIRATDDARLDVAQELDRLNSLVITETNAFFERVVGRTDTGTTAKSATEVAGIRK
jgi:hypothetical protein